MPGLTSDITRALDTLCRGCEGIDAVLTMNPDGNRFSRALTDLQQFSVEQDLPMAIVGGLGAIRYGYPAATQQIDIAVGRDHLGKLIQLASRYRMVVAWESQTGWHTLTHGDVASTSSVGRNSSAAEIGSVTRLDVPGGRHRQESG